jgi:hypothetical protein
MIRPGWRHRATRLRSWHSLAEPRWPLSVDTQWLVAGSQIFDCFADAFDKGDKKGTPQDQSLEPKTRFSCLICTQLSTGSDDINE